MIKFSWGSGWMRVDPDILICDMPMTDYRKWVKLFAKHATWEQADEFLQVLERQIGEREQRAKELEAEILEFQMKAERKIPSVLAPKYCREQAALKQKHLNGTQRGLKRCYKMLELLKELLP